MEKYKEYDITLKKDELLFLKSFKDTIVLLLVYNNYTKIASYLCVRSYLGLFVVYDYRHILKISITSSLYKGT